MKNLEISLPLVNGKLLDTHYGEISGKNLIHEFIGDGTSPPPKRMRLQVTTESGKVVVINIPYDDNSDASIYIDDVEL
ncbi:MAG: hypothetical protein K0A93_10430 [Desulfuromonadaceae bacterium]|nr:hypothetical protein [Desulfuromonadaceae bacterium]